MNVEIGTEAEKFPEKEYINEIFLAVYVCISWWSWDGGVWGWECNCVYECVTVEQGYSVSW